ncbi:alginate lyase family protein [Exiguobacterium sp. s131]|uniref:alginate lyase family protein n=1 Tax=Exiguobacterium sp. s131 TaxID=2751278 RepID=UPI001BE67ED4|nr:alginate lyase family protein [Exiguobacterium sp. s131]
MEHSHAKQIVAQLRGSLSGKASDGWDVVISAGTMCYQWKGRRMVPDSRLETTETVRLIRPYGRYYIVHREGREALVRATDVMLLMTEPLSKIKLTDKMERLLVRDYMKQKRTFASYHYEQIRDEQAVHFAEETLSGRWYIPSLPHTLTVRDVRTFDWNKMLPLVNNNSFLFQLHYLTTVNQLTHAYEVTQDERYLHYAHQIIDSWQSHHPLHGGPRGRVAYHAHGTAIRVFHILRFFEAYRQAPIHHDARVTCRLLHLLYEHATLLATPTFYRPLHNHGLFQDMALFAIASCFPEFDRSADWRRIARARLNKQLDICLSEDGTHLEHSPGYHVYVYHTLSRFRDWADLNGFTLPEGIGRIDRMPKRLLHFIKPNQTLPIVGDTGGQLRGSRLIPRIETFPELAFAMSGGTQGQCPEELLANLGSQYAVMREYWHHAKRPFRDATYILMTAGYHGGAHKHADDLSLELYGLGRDFIVETGRYGYVDGPERAQALRVAAHNTVHRLGEELDLSIERIGESGILEVKEARKQMTATGVSRLIGKEAIHTRHVVYDKARTLVVFDRIVAPEADLFVQRFHLAPGLDLVSGTPEEHNVRFKDASNRAIQFIQLLKSEEAYMALELSHVSMRDLEWTPRQQVVSIEHGSEVRFLTLIRLDRTGKRVVDTKVEERDGVYIVSYWIENGGKHVIHVPCEESRDV